MSGLVLESSCRRLALSGDLPQVGGWDFCLSHPLIILETDWVRYVSSSLYNIYLHIDTGDTAHRREIKHSYKYLQGEAFDLFLPNFPAQLYSGAVKMTCLCPKGRIFAVSTSGISEMGTFWDIYTSFSCNLQLH